MADYLDNLPEYTAKATLVIANLGFESFELWDAGEDDLSILQTIAAYDQWLQGANDTSQDRELRLVLLTLLVDQARLNNMVTTPGIASLYQVVGPTDVSTVPFDLVTGDILSNASAAAQFALYLKLAGGTMTGPLLISPSTRIDSTGNLFIGNNTATTITIGRTGQNLQIGSTITQGIWNGSAIGVAYGGLGTLSFAAGAVGQSVRKNGAGTGFEWFTPGTGSGDVAGPGDSISTDNAIVRWNGSGGRTIQNSTVLIGDAGEITGALSLGFNGATSGTVTISAPGAIGTRALTLQALSGAIALDANRLDFFAATTSAQLITKITDPQGTGRLVFNDSPTLITPTLGAAIGTSVTLTGAFTSGVLATSNGRFVWRNDTNSFTQAIRGSATPSDITYALPVALPTVGQVLTSAAPSGSVAQLSWTTITALVNPMSTLGDMIYGAAAGAPTRLAGDTSNTRKFLRELSVASVATAPVWDTLLAADIPTIAQSQVSGLVAALDGKLSDNLPSGQVFIGNLSGLASPVTPSGDWTILSTGVNTIGANKVLFSKFQQATGPQILVGTPDILGAQDFRQITLDPATLSISALGVMSAIGFGTGDVTHTGNLTSNSIVLGNGVADVKVGTGFTTDGVSKLTIGVAGSSVGGVLLTNATSGTVELRPVTGALGTSVLSLPVGTDTLVGLALSQALTNKTLTSSTNVLGGVTTTMGSDATGDVYYRNAGGVLTRLGIGSSGQALKVSGGLPAWGAAGASVVNSSFTSQTSVTVNHSLGYYPIVQAIDSVGALLVPATVVHASTSQFTITFSTSTTGNILYI